MKRRQEAAEKAEQDRLRAEAEAKAALQAQAEEARRAEAARDQADAPGSPRREHEAGKDLNSNYDSSTQPQNDEAAACLPPKKSKSKLSRKQKKGKEV